MFVISDNGVVRKHCSALWTGHAIAKGSIDIENREQHLLILHLTSTAPSLDERHELSEFAMFDICARMARSSILVRLQRF